MPPRDALDLSVEELGYVIEVAIVNSAAAFAPLSPDPEAYVKAASAIREDLLAQISESASDVQRFLDARAKAYGQEQM
jgi:hypothetical protein